MLLWQRLTRECGAGTHIGAQVSTEPGIWLMMHVPSLYMCYLASQQLISMRLHRHGCLDSEAPLRSHCLCLLAPRAHKPLSEQQEVLFQIPWVYCCLGGYLKNIYVSIYVWHKCQCPPPPHQDPPAGVGLRSRTSLPYFGVENLKEKGFGSL